MQKNNVNDECSSEIRIFTYFTATAAPHFSDAAFPSELNQQVSCV
jgi:hypothetical protein